LKNLFEIEAYRSHLSQLLRILAIVGVLWIISFPYTAQDVFTSEKALEGAFLES
jgi:hypothetical protein